MKIGILTFHYAHNYGAMLQAYALSTKLNLMGFDAEIIDYRHPYIYNNHEILNIYKLYKNYRDKNSFIISILKSLKNYNKNQNRDDKWKKFENFLNNSLKKSTRIYSRNLSLLSYDIYICGSDQIWNPQLTGGLEPIYFANTASSKTKKIAYAASNGENIINESILNSFLYFIELMDSISLREQLLTDYLNKKTKKNIQTVLDPVFLLNEKEWGKITKKPVESDYILTYSFHEDDIFYRIVDEISNRLKMKVVRFCFEKKKSLQSSIIQIDNGGPNEFLGYFQNASFVITNSFHGTAFSILYQKQFYCVPPKLFRERIDSLLEVLDMSNRIIDSVSDIKIEQFLDYTIINNKLERLKEKSLSFIISSLNKKEY